MAGERFEIFKDAVEKFRFRLRAQLSLFSNFAYLIYTKKRRDGGKPSLWTSGFLAASPSPKGKLSKSK